jgi:SrtB family sortase
LLTKNIERIVVAKMGKQNKSEYPELTDRPIQIIRNRPRRSKISITIMTTLAIAAAICLVIGLKYAFNYIQLKAVYEEAAGTYSELLQYSPAMETESDPSLEPNVPATTEPVTLSKNTQKLLSINSNYACWIKVNGTHIDYPVVKATDNEYWLYHLFDGTMNGAGTLFADVRCHESVMVIWGHNMLDGSMFSDLNLYINNPEYLKEYTIIQLTSADDKMSTYQILDACYVPEHVFDSLLKPDADPIPILNNLGVQTSSNDTKILVLATCTGSGSYGERTAVFAELIH